MNELLRTVMALSHSRSAQGNAALRDPGMFSDEFFVAYVVAEVVLVMAAFAIGVHLTER